MQVTIALDGATEDQRKLACNMILDLFKTQRHFVIERAEMAASNPNSDLIELDLQLRQ